MADESISSVKYRKFLESSEDAYPALTICFNIPFYEEKLKEYKVDLATYVRMLRGENITKFQEDDNEDYFDVFGPEDPIIPDLNITQKLYSIPYEEVSFAFKEDRFSIASYIKYEKSGKVMRAAITFKPNPFLRNNRWKCFTGEVQSKKPISMWQIYTTVNNINKAGVVVSAYMHFAGSMMVSRKHLLMAKNMNKASHMKMDFGIADVTKKRSTQDSPCQANTSILDEIVVRQTVSRIGCVPPYLKNTFHEKENQGMCSPKQLKQLSDDLDFPLTNIENMYRPCKDLFALFPRIVYEETGKEYRERFNLTTKIQIHFLTDEFKYISELQAYPAWSFMAEVGGYAGLFIGFSFLQFPDIIQYAFQNIAEKKRWISDK